MQQFRTTWRPTLGYCSTAPVTGESSDYVYRGQNLIHEGPIDKSYMRQWTGYGGVGSLGGLVSLTGTVAINGTDTVTGTGTKFQAELITGQLILINFRIYAVTQVVSNTSIKISPNAASTASGLTAYFCVHVQEVDNDRMAFQRGSMIRLPQGNFLGVGRGQVNRNGSLFSGFVLSDQLQIAVFDNGAGTYSIYKLGMKTPVSGFSVAATGSGTKNMQAGDYSLAIVPARIATGGFNNPTAPQTVTLTTGQRVNVTFPAMDTGAGQDAWRVYVTLFSTDESVTGPWYYYDTITTTLVSAAGGTVPIEWRDAEVSGNDILEFDNDPPPPGVHIASLGGIPVLLGCNGPGRTLTGTVAITTNDATVTGTGTQFTSELAVGRFIWINNLIYKVLEINSNTSMEVSPTPTASSASGLSLRSADEAPGPVLRPAKPYLGGWNIEAFSGRSAIALNPPETIIGFVEGVGRLFLLTPNRLHMATLTGDDRVPISTRPYWKVGFTNPRACCFVNGFLYGFTTNGATRSSGTADEVSEEHEFAAPVAADMATWNAARVSVAYDPKNEAVIFFHADDGLRPGGTKRYSTALMYMLRSGRWSCPIRIEALDDLADYFVTSAATVSGKFYFAAVNTIGSSIYDWDAGGGNLGEVYAGTPFMDMGAEGFDKSHEGVSLTAHGAGIKVQIYGAGRDEDVPIGNFEAGTSSDSGDINFTPGAGIRTFAREEALVLEKRVLAARITLSTFGNNGARIDELVMDGKITRHKN